jgi:broad specificity phosphatase PhoE
VIYLVRHAKAGHRARWTEPDELRPLTKSGWRQAEALVGLFDGQPFARLVSSPYVRCVQTLEPLAKARSLPIENADELAEGAPRTASVDLLLRSADDGPVALSTHGDIIENVLDELSRLDVPLDGPVALEKGSTWVIDVADGAFTGARYVPPPGQ